MLEKGRKGQGAYDETSSYNPVVILLFYPGVAWALQKCLAGISHLGHKAAAITAYYDTQSQLASPSSVPRHPVVKLNCPLFQYQVTFAVQPSPVRRPARPTNGLRLKSTLPPGSLALSGTKDLHLRHLSVQFRSISFATGLPLHLILSSLRI